MMSLLVVDRFGRSLRFYYLEFDKKAIYDDCKIPGIDAYNSRSSAANPWVHCLYKLVNP